MFLRVLDDVPTELLFSEPHVDGVLPTLDDDRAVRVVVIAETACERRLSIAGDGVE
jgi:hypothetical protein